MPIFIDSNAYIIVFTSVKLFSQDIHDHKSMVFFNLNNSLSIYYKTFYFCVLNQKFLMSTIQQTLRKARQVDQKFKAFMSKKDERDKSMEQTFKKIKQTQQTIANTKNTIGKIDSLYENFEKRFSQAINSALKSVEKNVLFNVPDPNWKPNRITSKQFVQNIKKSKQILFLTGAGISVASGIQTFRGANGFWDKENLKNQIFENVQTPEDILTLRNFEVDEFTTWKWLINFYKIKEKAKPNKGHEALHKIIQEILGANKKAMIVTQNIDDFHPEALFVKKQGKKPVFDYPICEVHGNIKKLRCDTCSQAKKEAQFYEFKNYIKSIQSKQSPKCPKCESLLRPHVMFYDEFYSQLYNQVSTVREFQKQTDLLVVIGTALQTGLARQIVEDALQKKISIIEINLECEIKRPGCMWMEGKADQILQKSNYELWKTHI